MPRPSRNDNLAMSPHSPKQRETLNVILVLISTETKKSTSGTLNWTTGINGGQQNEVTRSVIWLWLNLWESMLHYLGVTYQAAAAIGPTFLAQPRQEILELLRHQAA